MVNAVSAGGYQAYSYQQAVNPVQQDATRGGDNRIQFREQPAGDSQRANEFDKQSPGPAAAQASTGSRGKSVDIKI